MSTQFNLHSDPAGGRRPPDGRHQSLHLQRHVAETTYAHVAPHVPAPQQSGRPARRPLAGGRHGLLGVRGGGRPSPGGGAEEGGGQNGRTKKAAIASTKTHQR